MVRSILLRPWDFLCVLWFATHIPITILLDSQSVLPPHLLALVPHQLRDLLQWHIRTNGDHLVRRSPPRSRAAAAAPRRAHAPAPKRPPACRRRAAQVRDNPVWFVAFVWCELALQLPFFFVAIYAYVTGANWVRVPAIAYGVHAATTVVPMLADIWAGAGAGNPQREALGLIYAAYLAFPLLIAASMAASRVPFPADRKKKAALARSMPRPNAADRRWTAESSAALERAAAAPDLAAYGAQGPAVKLMYDRAVVAWDQWRTAAAPDPAGFAPDPAVLRLVPLLGRAVSRGLALVAAAGSWKAALRLKAALLVTALLEALAVHIELAAMPDPDKAALLQQLREQGLLSALAAASVPLAAELEQATRGLEEQQQQLEDRSGLQLREDTSAAMLQTWVALAQAELTMPSAVLVAQLAPLARLAAASLHGQAARAAARASFNRTSGGQALYAVRLITGIISAASRVAAAQHGGGGAGSELFAVLDAAVADRRVQFCLCTAFAASASKVQQQGGDQADGASGGSRRQRPEALAAAVGRLLAALGLEGLEGLHEEPAVIRLRRDSASASLSVMLADAANALDRGERSLSRSLKLPAWSAAAVGVLVQLCVLAPGLSELDVYLHALVAAVRVAGREAGVACLGDAQAPRLLPGALLSRLQRATAEERAQGWDQGCAAGLLGLLMEMCCAGPTKAALLAELAEQQPSTAAAGAEAALRTAANHPHAQVAPAVLSALCTEPCGLQPAPALAALLTTALKVAAARAGGDSKAQFCALAAAVHCAAASPCVLLRDRQAAGPSSGSSASGSSGRYDELAPWLALAARALSLAGLVLAPPAAGSGAAAANGQAGSRASGLGARLLPPAVLAPLVEQAAASSEALAAARERLQAAGPGSGDAAAQLAVLRAAVGPALAAQLAALGGAVSGAVPLRSACSNPGCADLARLSEAALVKGTHHLCAGCRVARAEAEAAAAAGAGPG
ncbi:tmem97 [Scenedesmus sp. PABB004]|nr:tmem97 [Scenedesmus sp. PABB004]